MSNLYTMFCPRYFACQNLCNPLSNYMRECKRFSPQWEPTTKLHKTSLTTDTHCKFRGSWNHPQVHKSTRRTHRTHWMLLGSCLCLLQEKDTDKISQGNRHRAESWMDPHVELQLNSVNSSWWGCVTLCTEYSQPGKLTWAFGVQSFTGAQSHTACMADLQSPVLPGGRTATTQPKALIIKSHS